MSRTETVDGSELAEDSLRSSQMPMHRGAPANPANRYIDCCRAAQCWEESGGWGEAVGGRRWAAHQPSRLLKDSFLLGARAKNCANLSAVRFGLGSGLYRAFGLSADLI